MRKRLIVVITGLIAQIMVFAATPQVKNVKAFQQYPWEKVCISYEVVGDVAASAIGVPFLRVSAKDKTTGRVYDATAASLSGDTGIAAGLHAVVWDIGAQGVTINSSNVVFTVVYDNAVFLSIDLSAGAHASSYPVSYLESAPSGDWSEAYKATKLVLRRIPAGTFKMRGTANVTLTKPFYIGVLEVMQKQYELVMGENPSHCKGGTLPVEQVSYDMIRGSSNGAKWPSSSAVDSSSFIGKLRARTGLNFDLPTEAQWEYACRAGTTTLYYWGDRKMDNYAWYRGNSSGKTHSVESRWSNAWGLYGMSGNVSEWCLDWYGTLAYGTDPKGPSSGSLRVCRGGSYNSSAGECSSDYREDSGPGRQRYDIGFRLAIQPVE